MQIAEIYALARESFGRSVALLAALLLALSPMWSAAIAAWATFGPEPRFAFGLVAFGFLGMGPVTIAVDSYGPVTDNAQSVFELSVIETIPGKGWFTILRLYSPLEPFFTKKWRPSEIELVK